jgi:hypothetical protein
MMSSGLPNIIALEPRIMFDGAMAADMAGAAAADDGDTTEQADITAAAERRELVIVDPAVAGYQELIAGLGDGAEVLVLSMSAGIGDVAAALQGTRGLDAIHLISHGDVGAISLGGQRLDGSGLQENAAALQAIGAALAEDGDILLYGCRVAADGDGAAFVAQLSELTGADVAASDDLTGAAGLGGDWDMENQSGEIETAAISGDGFAGVLATPSLGSGENVIYATDNAAAVVASPSLSVSSGSGYGDGGTLKIAITGAAATETLALTTVSTADTTSGVVSVEGTRVYLGNGTSADEVGSIDSTDDGSGGKTLTINLTGLGSTAAISNGGFETGDLTNWTSGLTQVDLGTSSIDGVVTPTDTTDPASSGGDSDVPTTLGTLTAAASNTDKTTGTYAAQLKSTGMTTANGFDVVHGPSIFSDSFAATSGQVINFDWRALGGGDAYDVFAYIQKSDGTQTTILDETGSSAAGSTLWATASVTIPSDGNYKFVFVSGTYDFTGGRAAGASLFIDNIASFDSNPGLVTNAVVRDIARLVTYANSSVDTTDIRTITFTATQKDGNNGSATSTINGEVVEEATPPTTPAPAPPAADEPIVEAPADDGEAASLQTFIGGSDGGDTGLVSLAGGETGLQTFIGSSDAVIGITTTTTTTTSTTSSDGAAGPGASGDAGRGGGDDQGQAPRNVPTVTTTSGFQVAVSAAGDDGTGGGGSVIVMNGIDDVASVDQVVSFRVPADAFAVGNVESVVQLRAVQSDGSALPAWLKFNADTGQFTGTAAAGFAGIIDVSVTATDENGNQASTTFSLAVGGEDGAPATPPAAAPAEPEAPDGQQMPPPGQQSGLATGENGAANGALPAGGRASFTDQVASLAGHGRLVRHAALMDALQKVFAGADDPAMKIHNETAHKE